MTSEVESCGPESTYAYAEFKMESTLITEFDMVCNSSREVIQSFIESSRYLEISGLGAHDWVLLHVGPRTWQPRLWSPL